MGGLRTLQRGSLSLALILVSVTASIPPAGAANETEELLVPDPAGDVVALGAPAPAPASPATDAQDIRRLRVFGADEEGFKVELGLADIRAPLGFVNSDITGSDTAYRVDFRLDGTETRYQIRWDALLGTPDRPSAGTVPIWALFCVIVAQGGCQQQRIVATLDWDHSTFGAHVSHRALRGLDPLTPATAAAGAVGVEIPAGALLVDWLAQSGPHEPMSLYDRAPNTGFAGPFRLPWGETNDGVRVGLNDPDAYPTFIDRISSGHIRVTFPRVPIPPAQPTPIQLRIHNDGAEARQLNVTTRLLGEPAGANWNIRLLPTLTLPGGQSRVVNLIVTTSNVELGDTQTVQVAIHDTDDVLVADAVTLRLMATAPPPGPASRTLVFHAAKDTYTYRELNQAICRLPVCAGTSGWMNTQASDPRATSDEALDMKVSFASGFPPAFRSQAVFRLDAPSPNDLVLDGAASMRAFVRFQSDVPLTGELLVRVTADDLLVGETKVPATIGASSDLAATLPVNLESTRIRAGSGLAVSLVLTYEPTSPAPASNAASPPRIVPKSSGVEIPFIPDPLAKEIDIPAGPAAVGLSTDRPAEDFVNPGRTALFNLTVVNEGILEDIVRVDWESDMPRWSVLLQPGKSFRLASGESVVLGLLVTAPANVPEGEKCTLQVNATSQADPATMASLRFVLTATNGTDIVDEEDQFVADADARERASREGRGVPAPLASLAVAVLAGAAASRPRRP